MRDVSEFWSGSAAPPVTDETVTAWEERLKVKLPSSLLGLYRIHNGGPCCGGYPFELLPLDHAPRGQSVCSLEELAADGAYLDEDGLESLGEAIGDPRKIVTLAFDGASCLALNYNATGPDGEPKVLWIDLGGSFMFGDWRELHPTFRDFVAAVLRAEK